jgi:hypothetical protein
VRDAWTGQLNVRAVARVLVARVTHDAADVDALGRLVARVGADAQRTRLLSDFAGLALRHRLWEVLVDTKAQVRVRVRAGHGRACNIWAACVRVRVCVRVCVCACVGVGVWCRVDHGEICSAGTVPRRLHAEAQRKNSARVLWAAASDGRLRAPLSRIHNDGCAFAS